MCPCWKKSNDRKGRALATNKTAGWSLWAGLLPKMLYRVQVGVLLAVACLFTVESNAGSGEAKIPFSSSLPLLPTPASTPGNPSSNLKGYHDFAGALVNGVRPGQLPHGMPIQ